MQTLTAYRVAGTQFQPSNFFNAITKAKGAATRKAPGIVMSGNLVLAKVRKNGLIIFE